MASSSCARIRHILFPPARKAAPGPSASVHSCGSPACCAPWMCRCRGDIRGTARPSQVCSCGLSFTRCSSSSKYLPENSCRTFGTPRRPFSMRLRRFQHCAGRPAAAVAVAEGDQDVVVDFFILIALPGAHDRVRMQHPVVGCEILVFLLPDTDRGDEMRQDLAAVDAPPQERIVWEFIELIPRKLCRHEISDPALFHNLRQRAVKAERVRQPEDFAFHAEFFAEKALAEQNLPHQRFAGRQVAVGFQPHGAFRFPALFLARAL